MGGSAWDNIKRNGAPQYLLPGSITPKSPEQIEPLVGALNCSWQFSSYGPIIRSDSVHTGGPGLHNFWLGQTVKGKNGQIRSGFRRIENGRYFYTTAGDLGLSTVMYKNVFDRMGRIYGIGVERQEDDGSRDIHGKKDLNRLIARGIFELLNGDLANKERLSMNDILEKSMMQHAAAEERFEQYLRNRRQKQ